MVCLFVMWVIRILKRAFQSRSLLLITVQSFGTEDRIREDGMRIPPKQQIFKMIVFRGADIQDLNVITAATVRSSVGSLVIIVLSPCIQP